MGLFYVVKTIWETKKDFLMTLLLPNITDSKT
jgi:hypothetical protein